MSYNYNDLNPEMKQNLREVLMRYRSDIEVFEMAKNRLSKIFDTFFNPEDLKKRNISVLYSCSRVKDEDSVLKKLIKKTYEEEREFTYEDLTDIVGIRLICLSTRDIRDLCADILDSPYIEKYKKDDKLLVKDYISKPKKSGYRGLHIIVNVPVEVYDENGNIQVRKIPCEIQLRTILMDIYATAEHANYKKDFEGIEKQRVLDIGFVLNYAEERFDLLHDMYKPNEEIVVDEKVKREFEKIEPLYSSAKQIAEGNINLLIDEFSKSNPNSFKYMRSRIKPVSSITRKMKAHNYEISSESIRTNIKDLIGFNIVCYDKEEIKKLIEYFKSRIGEDHIIEIKDYLDDNAKESGYMAYHMIISVPVYGIDVPVEIQFKSMLMEAWSLHDDYLYGTTKPEDYKNELYNLSMMLKSISLNLGFIKSYVSKTKTESIVKKIDKESSNRTKKVLKYKRKKDEK